MAAVRFVGLPRPMLNAAISEMEGWRRLGYRMLERAKAECPVGEEVDGWEGPHLRDTLIVTYITGGDPRVLIGSKAKGDVLHYQTDGTTAHFVAPVNAKALRWTSGGQVFFSMGHEVSGVKPNQFILHAMGAIVRESGR